MINTRKDTEPRLTGLKGLGVSEIALYTFLMIARNSEGNTWSRCFRHNPASGYFVLELFTGLHLYV